MTASPLLLGHRGARGVRSLTENTFSAFDHAVQAGCDGFEFDVRLSGDRRAVILHDSRCHGLGVASSAFSQLLQTTRPRSNSKNAALREGHQLVCLEDVLSRYGSRAFLDIELKVPGLETIVLDALRQSSRPRGYVISSFLPDVLWEVKARSSRITGMICDRKTQLARWSKLPAEYLILEQKLLNRLLVDELHAAKRKVFVWTVNTPARMRRFADWGVDGIISDDPELLVQTLRPGSAKVQS